MEWLRFAKETLLIADAKNFYEHHLNTLKNLSRKNVKITYITFNHPYPELYHWLAHQDVNLKKFFFVDASKSLNSKQMLLERGHNFISLNSNSLSDLALVLNELLKNFQEQSIILLDSIPALLHHNNKREAYEFIQFLKILEHKRKSKLLLLSTKQFRRVNRELSLLCNSAIKI